MCGDERKRDAGNDVRLFTPRYDKKKKLQEKGVKALRESIWLVMINTFKQLKIIISNLL